MKSRALLVVPVLVLSVQIVDADPAGASTGTSLVTAEAWYQPDPAGVPLPPASPYPAGTLHVAQQAGQETARTYVALRNPHVDLGPVRGGQLTIALDTDVSDGSMSPDNAQVLVCTTSAPITSVEGSFDSPPTSDCSLGVQAVYSATPHPQLVADLFSLAAALSKPNVGLALQPVAAIGQTNAWHVVFSSHTRVNPTTPPLSVTLTYADPMQSAPLSKATTPGLTAQEPSRGAGPVPIAAGILPILPPTTVATPVMPSVAAPPANPSPIASSVRVVGHPYRHPEIWFLPLVLVLVVPAINRALARDLSWSVFESGPLRTTGAPDQ